MSTRLSEPQINALPSGPSLCACCGRALGRTYYYLPGRSERYCGECMAGRPRCDSCAAPIGGDGWRLHDGRMLCSRCHRTAIYNADEARSIFQGTLAQLAQRPGLELRVGVAFRLVDAPTLARLGEEGGLVSSERQHMLGLYQRNGRLRVVYALYGLPLLLFRTVVAHELAHAWQGENAPLLRSPLWLEGFAEWVAYHHLLQIGASKGAERMLSAEHPYREGLEQCLLLERQLGMAGVIERMRRLE